MFNTFHVKFAEVIKCTFPSFHTILRKLYNKNVSHLEYMVLLYWTNVKHYTTL